MYFSLIQELPFNSNQMYSNVDKHYPIAYNTAGYRSLFTQKNTVKVRVQSHHKGAA